MSEDKGFLSRWSDRKLSAEQDEPESSRAGMEQAEEPADEFEGKSDDEILSILELPDPETLTLGDTVEKFMSGRVPERIRARALRAFWKTNPVLANLDGLDEYWDDYTDAAMIIENMETIYQVGKGYATQALDALESLAEDESQAQEAESIKDEVYQTKSPGISRSFEKLYGLGIPDDPTPYLWLQKRAKDMSVGEIERLLDRFPDSKGQEMIPYQLRKAQLWWNGPACLVALLIGLGLGSARGSSTPAKLAGVSLLGALGFYLIRTLSDSLGEQQILTPMVTASLPYVVVVIGVFIFLKIQK